MVLVSLAAASPCIPLTRSFFVHLNTSKRLPRRLPLWPESRNVPRVLRLERLRWRLGLSVESILPTVQVIIVEILRKTQNTLSLLECTLDLFPLASPNVRCTSLVGHEHHHDIMAWKSTLKKTGQKKKWTHTNASTITPWNVGNNFYTSSPSTSFPVNLTWDH